MNRAQSLLSIAGLTVTILLAGCGTPGSPNSGGEASNSSDRKFYLSINSFHDLPSDTTGRSFVVLGDTNLIGSLENESYLQVVGQGFKSHQHRSVQVTDNPDWLVIVEYENLPPQKYSSTHPVYGQTGGRKAQHQGTVYGPGGVTTYQGTTHASPQYGVVGHATDESLFIGWRVRLQIYDGAAYRQNRVKQIYDARMVAAGTGGSLSQAFPLLIREMFRDFPSTSGAKRERYVSY